MIIYNLTPEIKPFFGLPAKNPKCLISRKIISVIVLLVLFCTDVSANTAVVENKGEGKYKAVRLVPEIYNNANSDLSDIRIRDAKGHEIPYFIYNGKLEKRENDDRQEYPMVIIDSYLKDENFYFDYVVRDIPDRDITATSLEVITANSGFAKNITLYGSYDGINWTFIQDDTLYNIDGNSKLSISFNRTVKFAYYRFRLGNNLERISFDSMKLVYERYALQERIYFIESIIPRFNVEEKDKTTYINIEGLKNLRLAEIKLETDSMFKRTVRTEIGVDKELYNLSFNDIEYNDTALAFDWQIPKGDIFTLQINNGDDRPININGITVKYYADELVFEFGLGEEHTIYFGDSEIKALPVYDIERYRREVLKGEIDRLDIKEIIITKSEDEPQRDYTLIFNIVVVIVAIGLGVLILVRLIKKK